MFVWYRENGLCRIKQGRQIQSGPASETLTVDSNVIGKETTAGAAPGIQASLRKFDGCNESQL